MYGPLIVHVETRGPREVRDVRSLVARARDLTPPVDSLPRLGRHQRLRVVLDGARAVLPAFRPPASRHRRRELWLHQLRPHARLNVAPVGCRGRVVSGGSSRSRRLREEVALEVVADWLVVGEAVRIEPAHPGVQGGDHVGHVGGGQRRTEPVEAGRHADSVVSNAVAIVGAWILAARGHGGRHRLEQARACRPVDYSGSVVDAALDPVAQAEIHHLGEVAVPFVSLPYVREVRVRGLRRRVERSAGEAVTVRLQRGPGRVLRSGTLLEARQDRRGQVQARRTGPCVGRRIGSGGSAPTGHGREEGNGNGATTTTALPHQCGLRSVGGRRAIRAPARGSRRARMRSPTTPPGLSACRDQRRSSDGHRSAASHLGANHIVPRPRSVNGFMPTRGPFRRGFVPAPPHVVARGRRVPFARSSWNPCGFGVSPQAGYGCSVQAPCGREEPR